MGGAALRHALRALRRDWRAGEVQVLLAALVVAVASVSAVSFFTDRIQRGIDRQAGELLAADLLVESPDDIPEAWGRQARALGLDTARTLTFPTMTARGERFQLADVKAVSPEYPLRGELRVAERPFGPERVAPSGPPPGEAWVDPRLLGALELAVGEAVTVGQVELAVTQVLAFEPDRGGDLFTLGPRLLMHLDDIPATGLVQRGSRVRHHLLVAGPPEMVDAYRDWLAPRLGERASLQGVRDARPEMRVALERADRFLGLAALVSVVLAGLAVAIAARRYAERHLDPVAILRCLGASQAFVARTVLLQVLATGLLGSLLGLALGFAAQHGLVALLADLLPTALPGPGWRPVAAGLATGLVTLAGFALPPFLGLPRVSPLRVLRRDLGPLPTRAWVVYGAALAALVALVVWQAADQRLAAYALAGIGAVALVLVAASLGLLRALEPLRHRGGAAWRLGLAGLTRRRRQSTAQTVAFGTGILVLLLLALVRTELLAGWQDRLPPDTPNVFLINIQPEEVDALAGFLAREGVAQAELYPMVRGRLVAIDGEPVGAGDYASPRAQRLIEREFNLSWAQEPQEDNRIVAGTWWPPGTEGSRELSVEEGIAETLGIALGDTLRFSIGGAELEAEVTSLRTVQWDSFNVNFFIVAPPGVLEDYPATWITSFHLPAERHGVLARLVQEFPSVTVLDVAALIDRVRAVMTQASLAIEYVFVFTLLAGLTVLAAAIQSTLDERRRESAVMRTLGGSRRQVLTGLATEFATLGALAGLLGAVGAQAVGLILAREVFGLAYAPGPGLMVLGLVAGAAGVALAGIVGTRGVLTHPPAETLRRA